MPHFIVTPFHGRTHYSVDFHANVQFKDGVAMLMHSNGSEKWPQPLEIIEIPEYVAILDLHTLKWIYETGQRPIARQSFQNASQLALLYNIAKKKLHKPHQKEITNDTTSKEN